MSNFLLPWFLEYLGEIFAKIGWKYWIWNICFNGLKVFAAWFSSYWLLKSHDSPLSLSPGLWSWSDPRSNVKPRPSGKMLKSLREEIEKKFFYKKFSKLKIRNILLIPKSNQAKFLVHFSHLPEARVLLLLSTSIIWKGVSPDWN